MCNYVHIEKREWECSRNVQIMCNYTISIHVDSVDSRVVKRDSIGAQESKLKEEESWLHTRMKNDEIMLVWAYDENSHNIVVGIE